MENYGHIWRKQRPDFWDWMWETRKGSEITERILERCLKADSIIEIGCGYGHFVKELIARGWKGTRYVGLDISDGPMAMRGIDPRVAAIRGDFMRLMAKDPQQIGSADLIISQAVLCHQAHWMPMVMASLECASQLSMDISYVTDEPLHGSKRRNDGCYDTYTSVSMLRMEIAALKLPIKVERIHNVKRKRDELLLTV